MYEIFFPHLFFRSKFSFNLNLRVITKMDDIFEIIDFMQFIHEDEDGIPKRYIRDHENPMEFFTSMQFYKNICKYIIFIL